MGKSKVPQQLAIYVEQMKPRLEHTVVSFRLEVKEHEELMRALGEDGLMLTRFIRASIRRYLDERKSVRPRKLA